MRGKFQGNETRQTVYRTVATALNCCRGRVWEPVKDELLVDAIWFRLIQVVGFLGTPGAVLVFYNAVHSWLSKRRGLWGKLQATVFAVASLGLFWFIFAGNLLRMGGSY